MKVSLAGLALGLLLGSPAWAGCEGGCSGQRAPAASTAWSGDAMAPSRLIVANPSHGYGGPVWIAIEFDIADGWFVYASATDEAAGPQLEWRGSANLAPPVLRWPAPDTRPIDGKSTNVYRGDVLLPVSVGPLDAASDIEIGLTLNYAVCGEVCRPAVAVHTIRLTAAPVELPPVCARQAADIAEVLTKTPP